MNTTVNESIPNPLQKQAGFAVPAALEAEIDELITHYPVKRSASLMLLHAIQEHFGWISQDAIEWTAKKLGLQPINIYELVTFYTMFRPQPQGKYSFKKSHTQPNTKRKTHTQHKQKSEKHKKNAHGHGPQTTKDGKFT